ncbi:hypothetical protein N665_0813s0001 [Sinapis alba]|nr:hypothetical protein N665_0813s0001 [Sinapis alba]
MYYDDHLAAAEKEISSRNFCNLVDAAILLYEKEKEKDIHYGFFDVFPRKRRSPLKKFARERSYGNLNEASTSSSLLDLNKSGDYSETEDPSDPLQCSYVSSPSSFLTAHRFSLRKRRAPQERSRITGGESKKARVTPFSWKGRATPECLVSLLEGMAANKGYLVTEGPWLIFEKKLTSTDVDPAQSRLLMPFKSLIRNDFLKPVELRIVAEEGENNGVGAMLVDQQENKWGLILMRREMMKKTGKGTLNYALICGWNDFVQGNGLKEDDDISVWYFRWRECPCFALVLPPPDIAQSSSSLDLCV